MTTLTNSIVGVAKLGYFKLGEVLNSFSTLFFKEGGVYTTINFKQASVYADISFSGGS